MKDFFNWRSRVLDILLFAGLASVLLIFSEDERPLAAWIKLRLCLLLAAAVCFFALTRLRAYWESRGDIPEIHRP